MFDTHCHLNFKAFKDNLPDVVERARMASVNNIIVPGTDLETSKIAVEIAAKYAGIYAAVGIHPHHAYEIISKQDRFCQKFFSRQCSATSARLEKLPARSRDPKTSATCLVYELEKLIVHPKVVAVGEIGLDKHEYLKTKYEKYDISQDFIEAQKELLIEQIKLAVKYKKAVILHNREAVSDILNILTDLRFTIHDLRMVFHCCQSEDKLLEFAKKHGIFIGVDGDVTYRKDKQEFVKKIPLELLVLETDSPYLLPEPLRSLKLYPNEPKNIPVIANFIAKLKNVSMNQFIDTTTENAKRLFNI